MLLLFSNGARRDTQDDLKKLALKIETKSPQLKKDSGTKVVP